MGGETEMKWFLIGYLTVIELGVLFIMGRAYGVFTSQFGYVILDAKHLLYIGATLCMYIFLVSLSACFGGIRENG